MKKIINTINTYPMINRVIIAIGFSLLISTLAGYITENQKYFLLSYTGKSELTKQDYEIRKNNKNVITEKVFNYETGIVTGIISLSTLLIYFGLKNNVNEKK